MPEVGQTYLVIGEMSGSPNASFHVQGGGRRPYSKELEDQAEAWYSEGERARRASQAEREAAKRRQAEEAAHFWAGLEAKASLETLLPQADTIAVGRICSGVGVPDMHVEVTELLRGPRLKEYRDGAYFLVVNAPEGAKETFFDQRSPFLLLLRAQGTAQEGGEPPRYTLLGGEFGVCPLTDAKLAAARAWCKEHPADSEEEAEIVERAKGWRAARGAELAFLHLDSELRASGRPESLSAEEDILVGRIRRMEERLERAPEETRRRAREDGGLRKTLYGIAVRRAGIAALRGAGYEDRGGVRTELPEEEAREFRDAAFRRLGDAVATGEATAKGLLAEADLAPLQDDSRWRELIDRLGD